VSRDPLTASIFIAGLAQFAVLAASALAPGRLHWRAELRPLPRLLRQMYWVYAGYIVLSICAFGLLSVFSAGELAGGSRLARGVCAYIAVFWGVRLALQGVFDVKAHLTTWWLKAGYGLLTLLFAAFTIVYAWAALR
jgi:hypothetical protein